MTLQEKEAFKKSIEEQIEALTLELAQIEKALYPERGEGPSDKVAHLNFKLDQSIQIQRHREATKRLNRLKQAYLRIDRPDYGLCRECEEPIPLERLKLMPESLYCVDCMNELGL